MCDQINPVLRKRMIREMADEIRRWFREWRRRNTVTGEQALQDYGDKGQTIRRNEQAETAYFVVQDTLTQPHNTHGEPRR